MSDSNSSPGDHVLHVHLNRDYPSIVRAEGIHLFDDTGRRFIDSAGGPILCNLGHGREEMARALYDQARAATMVYRMDLTTPILHRAADEVCRVTGGLMDRVFFVSGGSEATEIAVKLARKFHLETGQPSRHKVISRWMSYHGMTMGALAWSGMPGRRADYLPMLQDGPHIPPAYCYRCWFGADPSSCDLECARALETEILVQGPDNCAAFIAEPVSGMSLCGAAPRPEYFKVIREICDRYGLLLILDEVMTGFGRTGQWFGFQLMDVEPDIIALGKGLGGGYFPIGAACVTRAIYNGLANNPIVFSAGYSWAGNPLAAAIAAKTIGIMDREDLVTRSGAAGLRLAAGLERLRDHPTVGDIRGHGLMRGIEFVADKKTRAALDPGLGFFSRLVEECLDMGMYIEATGGCDRGRAGDQMMFGPPFIVTEDDIDEMIDILDRALTRVETEVGVV